LRRGSKKATENGTRRVTRDFDAAPSANVTRLSAKRRGFELPRAREFSMRRRSGPRLRSAYGRKGWRAHRCWNDGAVREREADETPPPALPRKNFAQNPPNRLRAPSPGSNLLLFTRFLVERSLRAVIARDANEDRS
jgi:hypothetical protein